MKTRCIHTSEFGYFYEYCQEHRDHKKLSKEISKFIELVDITNDLDARNNNTYSKKLLRKEERVEKTLLKIANIDKDFLLRFEKRYCLEDGDTQYETDPNIVSRNISQSFYDAYCVKKIKKENIVSQSNHHPAQENEIVLNISESEKNNVNKKKKTKEFTYFVNELKKCNYPNIDRQLNELHKVLETDNKKNESKTKYEKRVNKILKKANRNIDMIFKKGQNYPFRKDFIKILSNLIYTYDISERKMSDLDKRLKLSLHDELLERYSSDSKSKSKKHNYGYEISSDTSTNMLIKVNGDLIKEKADLLEKYNNGEKIKFDRPFASSIQTKKVDMINSYFDPRFECALNHDSSDKEYVKTVMDLCELADDITDDLFKKVLFDAHDSSNLSMIQSYEKNEALRTLYSLYSPNDKMNKYKEATDKFERIFKTLANDKRDNIYKLVYEEKQKKHLPIIELIPSCDTITSNLITRETKFIDSHAVEEFKHKALNYGKYLNYDLEIVARDIDIEDLPIIYRKLKRNIMYTNFVEEIKTGDDREKKYREARIVQNKTLAVAQEMIAKTILNKTYNREYDDISYDDYQNILNDIYSNVLHEERLLKSYDDFDDETILAEKAYQEKKKIWDENSAFVKALYLIISNR